MNIQNIAKECLKFGSGFCVISNGGDHPLYDELASLSDNVLLLFAAHITADVDIKYDVIIFPEPISDKNALEVLNIELVYSRTMLFIDTTHDNFYNNIIKTNRLFNDVWRWGNDNFITDKTNGTDMQPIDADKFTTCIPEIDVLLRKNTICKAVYAGPNKNIGSAALEKFIEVFKYIKEQFTNGASFIMFYDGDEAMDSSRVYKVLRLVKKFESITPNKTFFLLTSSLNYREQLSKLFSNFEQSYLDCLDVWPVPRFELVARENVQKLLHTTSDVKVGNEYDYTPKPKKFLCYNRMPRAVRRLIVSYLYKNNLQDQGIISLYDPDNLLDKSKRSNIDSLQNMHDDIKNLHHYFWNNIHKQLPIQLSCTNKRPNPVDVIQQDFTDFSETYFSIVNETYFYPTSYNFEGEMTTDAVFLSEKIFKPIIMKHPFIVAGRPGLLRYLKELGYQTMHPFINEDYDLEEDDDKRLLMILQEISRLCELTDEQWINIYKDLAPRLDHNFEMLARPRNIRLKRINFFKKFRDFQLDSLSGNNDAR